MMIVNPNQTLTVFYFNPNPNRNPGFSVPIFSGHSIPYYSLLHSSCQCLSSGVGLLLQPQNKIYAHKICSSIVRVDIKNQVYYMGKYNLK